MNKRLLILLLLLALTILLGVLQKDKEAAYISETDDFLVSDINILGNYILAESPPTYDKYTVLGNKIAYNGYLSDKWYNLISQYDWDNDIAYKIMMCESSGNPESENKKDSHRDCQGSYGLFQNGCVHFGKYGFTWENRFDPVENIRVAYEIYKGQGWKAWKNCYNKI